MAVNLSPIGGVAGQFFDNNGNPLTGGKIFTYAAGTTTPQATYTSAGGGTPHANPIILDAAGRVPGGEIWLTDGLQYKFVIKTSTDVQIGSYDNIIGINSNFVNYTNAQEIQTATAGQTVFTLTTMAYQPGTNSLSVFVDGVNQYGPGSSYAYQETSDTVVTFTTGLHVGAEVKFTTSAINASSAGDAEQVSYTPPFTGGVATNVEAKLAQMVSVTDFGAAGDGVTDDTAAFQAALDNGKPFAIPQGQYLVTDSLQIDELFGCTIVGEARTLPNTPGFPCIIFQPATKRDLFVWKNLPASYAFAAVQISGLAVKGAGPGAAAVFNLPRLYRGNIDAYIYTGIDHYAIIERWLDCNVSGNINGFRASAFRITNTTLSGGNITTRTDFDVYISGGDPAYTTYGFDIETFAMIGGKITNMIESVDCAIRMARGNTIDSSIYTENIPRTNAGALFEIGKIDAGTPDGTTVFTHVGVNLHGTNIASPGYNATVFADVDYCSSISIIGAEIKRFGSLLKTTANSKNISFTDTYAIGVELLEPTTTGIADFNELTFSGFRPVQMYSPHGNLFQYTNVATTAQLNPQGYVRPRWAYDRVYSTTSLSLWTSVGDGLFDWRLTGPQTFTGTDVVTPPASISAGDTYQVNVTVFGALAGDFAVASCGILNAGLTISARVTATDTVTVSLTNVTSSSITTFATTLRVFVTKAMV